MSKLKSSPPPWRYKESFGETHKHAVFGKPHPVDGGDYAPLARFSNPDDAKLVVAAVNHHEELVGVVKMAVSSIVTAEKLGEIGKGLFPETLKKLRELLAKIKKEAK